MKVSEIKAMAEKGRQAEIQRIFNTLKHYMDHAIQCDVRVPSSISGDIEKMCDESGVPVFVFNASDSDSVISVSPTYFALIEREYPGGFPMDDRVKYARRVTVRHRPCPLKHLSR